MASPASRELTDAFTMIRNAFPEGYQRLTKALSEYNYEFTVAVTEAPNDDILAAKGRAQATNGIFKMALEIYQQNRPAPPQ